MPRLEDKIFTKIERFNQQAEQYIDQQHYPEAIKEYQKAWNTLPEPRQLWDAALWIKVGQAECLLTLSDFAAAKNKLLEAMLCSGAVANPLVHLLLGISCFESDDKPCALEEFQLAHELEGDAVFQEGDEKYQQFLREHSA